MNIGFVGLGHMGSAMAGHLIKAGHAVTVFNRTRGKEKALVEQGARSAAKIEEVCGGEAVITMLADDAAVELTVFGPGGIRDHLTANAIHISMSTISVALSQRLTEAHRAAGQRFVAAPVFGRPDAAAAARIFILAGGARDAVEAATPLFNAMGQRLFVLGEEPPKANLVKLSGNFLIAALIESLGEAMALVGKAGIDRHVYLELLTSTLFTAPVYKTYGTLIADGKFEPVGFAAPLGQKDIRLVLAAGEALQVPLPFASLLRDRFLTLIAQGGEHLDWSAIGSLAARDSGQAG